MLTKLQKSRKAFKLYQKKLGFVGMLRYMLLRRIVPKGRLIRLKIKNGGLVFLRSKCYDTVIFSQIFIYEELGFTLAHAPEIIVDCGANIGLATLYFKFRYPNARIISIEPESSNFALLEKNTAAYKDVQLLKKGIWSKSGKLYIIDEGEGHASFRVSDTDPGQNVIGSIEATTINEILHLFNLPRIDLLKMDIEGSEKICFEDPLKTWIAKTGCIAVEVHEAMNPGCGALIDETLHAYRRERKGEYLIYHKQTQGYDGFRDPV